MTKHALMSALESLLFMSGEPLSYTRLGKMLSVPEKDIRAAISEVAERYQASEAHGFIVISDDTKVELATKPENALYVEALTKSALQENLSKAALEVLAIVAYRSPVSRAEIDAIRGVNCSFTLRNLLLRDLIAREGNPSDSRGYLYRPTLQLLEWLGISATTALPDYQTLSGDERLRLVLESETAPHSDETPFMEQK